MTPTPLQRALANAPSKANAEVVRPEREFFVFKAGELLLGVDSSTVREVPSMAPLTPLPRVASFVLGVMGYRGEVLPVIDLLRLFGQGESLVGRRSRSFIGIANGWAVAILVETIIGLRKVYLSDILPAPMGGSIPAEHLVGVTQAKDLTGTLTLLDLPKVLQSARQRAVSR